MRNALLFILLIATSSLSNSKPSPAVFIKIKNPTFKNWCINNKPKAQWDDVDWLAKMLMSETPDSTDIEGLRLRAITAAVHAEMHGISITKAILLPRAFSGVNRESYIWWRAEPTVTHKKIAIDMVSNGIREGEPRIYAFCNMSLISAKSKAWFNTLKFYKKIDDETFFLLP
jgi:hypothetical protein